MTRARGRRSAQPSKQADTVFQSDLAMNLFMVLMVILATLAAGTAAITQVGFTAPMTSEQVPDPQPPLGMVGSWAPVLPVLPRLVVRDGSVQRLDLDLLAESFAAGQPLIRGMDASRQPAEKLDPSAYLVELVLLDAPIPQEIVSWRISGKAFAAGDDSAWCRSTPTCAHSSSSTFTSIRIRISWRGSRSPALQGKKALRRQYSWIETTISGSSALRLASHPGTCTRGSSGLGSLESALGLERGIDHLA